ncbi:hypothetical protein ACN2C6_13540 [Caulobacter sp. ErkDOM-YI]|uniref:hypothetical protein n=1 Tax=unclassified Caulobacter TaxID=2648921 RepID=UPI003AF9D4F3
MADELTEVDYPFGNIRLPMSQMAMTEAPAELEALLRDAAGRNGIEILRDQTVELRCTSPQFPDATFVVFWPSGNERLNVLAPKGSRVGNA